MPKILEILEIEAQLCMRKVMRISCDMQAEKNILLLTMNYFCSYLYSKRKLQMYNFQYDTVIVKNLSL